MKKLYLLLTAVILTASAIGQAPQKMSYQAVIRNSSNQLVTGQSVGMQISILQGSEAGTEVYTETDPTTAGGIDITNNVISEHKYQIGDFAQGGIVFWLDETGEHGLVFTFKRGIKPNVSK